MIELTTTNARLDRLLKAAEVNWNYPAIRASWGPRDIEIVPVAGLFSFAHLYRPDGEVYWASEFKPFKEETQ